MRYNYVNRESTGVARFEGWHTTFTQLCALDSATTV